MRLQALYMIRSRVTPSGRYFISFLFFRVVAVEYFSQSLQMYLANFDLCMLLTITSISFSDVRRLSFVLIGLTCFVAHSNQSSICQLENSQVDHKD